MYKISQIDLFPFDIISCSKLGFREKKKKRENLQHERKRSSDTSQAETSLEASSRAGSLGQTAGGCASGGGRAEGGGDGHAAGRLDDGRVVLGGAGGGDDGGLGWVSAGGVLDGGAGAVDGHLGAGVVDWGAGGVVGGGGRAVRHDGSASSGVLGNPELSAVLVLACHVVDDLDAVAVGALGGLER